MNMASISLRIDLGEDKRFGPGKARLLELIRDTGSISAAARALGMSYRRAWLLADELNKLFGQRLVEPQHGGVKGGRSEEHTSELQYLRHLVCRLLL